MIRIKTEPNGSSDDVPSKKSNSRHIKYEPNDFEAQLMASDKPTKMKAIKREPANDFEAQLMEADKVPKKKKKQDRKLIDDDDMDQTLGINPSSPPTNGHAVMSLIPSSSSAGEYFWISF
jgi:hypothetical protein